MTLTLDSTVRDIHPRIAARRVGRNQNAPGAHQVVAEIDIVTVRQLLHH